MKQKRRQLFSLMNIQKWWTVQNIYNSCCGCEVLHFTDYQGEVFTLPHIIRLDSTRLQVIFQSPPGVQVPFFLVGTQPNHDTNFTQSPPKLQVESR
jgi:hypothetical protein